jgi:bacterioferritin (cytochrome b1)
MKGIKREQLTKDLAASQRKLNELVQQLNVLRQQEQLVSQEILKLQGRIELLNSLLEESGKEKSS